MCHVSSAGREMVKILAAAAVVVAIVSAALAWILAPGLSERLQQQSDQSKTVASKLILTPEELSHYDGTIKGRRIYLAIVGDVFDVTSGRRFYGPGKSYAHFSGRDATASFSTGDTEPAGLTDDIEGLDFEAVQGIASWHKFYVDHDNYTHVGVVVGRYYDPTGASLGVFPWEFLEERNKLKEDRKQQMPECNSKWSQASGSEVWCTTKSGGISRDWVGVPRIYSEHLDPAFDDGSGSGEKKERCACVPLERASLPYLRAYAGCELTADTCQVPK